MKLLCVGKQLTFEGDMTTEDLEIIIDKEESKVIEGKYSKADRLTIKMSSEVVFTIKGTGTSACAVRVPHCSEIAIFSGS